MRRIASLLLVVAASSTLAPAQTPAGPEFRVNGYTTADQLRPSLAVDARGDFVVVWMSRYQDGSVFGVFGQRYTAAGTPKGTEFQVNTYTTNTQNQANRNGVSSDADGNFVVIWTSFYQDGSSWGVFGQRYDSAGARRGAEFQVNTYTTGSQYVPSVSMAPNGGFVVVWSLANQSSGVLGQRYDGLGARLGAEFRISSLTTESMTLPVVDFDGSGNFVVAWEESVGFTGSSIVARRYDGSGNPRGSEFVVNTYTTGPRHQPSLAANLDGSFVIAWWADGVVGSAKGIFARRYDTQGSPLGDEFRVNTYTTGQQRVPFVAADASGRFVVSWDAIRDGNGYDVFAQRYDAAGAAMGSEFRVNTYTTGNQGFSPVSVDASGNFLLAWESVDQDGSGRGIYARRFGGLLPAALAADASGNGVLEPVETAVIAPSWQNVSTAAQAFGGVLSAFTGPAGATYTITDASADYGTVPDGNTGSCGGNCYGVTVTATSRPALHWDSSILETITPAALGQTKRWTLHLGDSFADVPRTNPFYRFVEALLHHSVTGGCGGGNYCPATATTREQMAVFVLVSRDGAGHVPPQCAPPNLFPDVPETNPFCRWIEELARRGVVGGCGGGNYCPTSPVTREQMAVFVLRTLDSAIDPPACVPRTCSPTSRRRARSAAGSRNWRTGLWWEGAGAETTAPRRR